MNVPRTISLATALFLLGIGLAASQKRAQNRSRVDDTSRAAGPIIDMHLHADSIDDLFRDAQRHPADSLEERDILFASSRAAEDLPSYHIWRMEPDGSDPRRLTSGEGVRDNFPVWSPDGTQIAFVSGRDEPEGRFGIYVMNADGSEVRAVGPRNWPLAVFPEWSPDGTEILFVTGSGSAGATPDTNVYLMNADGSDLRQLTTSESTAFACPSWGPDGDRIAYTVNRGDSWRLVIHDLASDRTKAVLSREGREGQCGYWSPDGRQIAFSSPPGEKDEDLFVVDLKTRTIEQLTDAGANSQYPRWSVDGRRLIFMSSRSIDEQSMDAGERHFDWQDVYTINPDGTGLERLTNNQHFDAHPSW